jgi:DNA polymerase III subunit beta
MKVTILQEHLAKALNHINKAVSSRPNIPVLANVLLETDKGQLKLSATNLEIGINTWVGADISQEGSLTVSAKLLFEFVNSLKSGKIELFQEGQSLVVNSVDNKAEFYIIPATDFPTVPEVEGEPVLEIDAQEFATSIELTAFAAGTDESRPVLTGILIDATNTSMTMVALDGFRLSKNEIKVTKKISEDLKEIIPAKALIEVEKLIKDKVSEGDLVKIYIMPNKNQMLFKINDIELSTRLIEGNFPDYQQILPSENTVSFKIKKEEFVQIIKIVSIFARNVVGNRTKFDVDTDNAKLVLSTNVVDVGNNNSQATIKNVTGENMQAGFNVKFLMDMVNAIEADEIYFESKGASFPGVFKNPKQKGYIHVIMPMRLE